jgi:hypothetical protein
VSDDLNVPQVPEASPEDPEDVSWALSTAEAMWARGEHADGIKWVRRAAEAASEAENDLRALELAKAAADLAGLLSRMTHVSIDLEEAPPSVPSMKAATPQRPPPPPVVKPPPPSVTKQVTTPSRPPAPLPTRTSQVPPAPLKGKPLGTNTKPPPARASVKPERKEPPTLTGAGTKDAKRGSRKSRENLEAEAKAAAAIVAAGAAVEVPVSKERVFGQTDVAAAAWASPPASQSSPPATVVGGMLPQNLSTAAGGASANASVGPRSPGAADGMITSQAVRVVVWRDGTGVHVAPAGTVVSAITVDAVLVALEPNADLTAWLSQRKG